MRYEEIMYKDKLVAVLTIFKSNHRPHPDFADRYILHEKRFNNGHCKKI